MTGAVPPFPSTNERVAAIRRRPEEGAASFVVLAVCVALLAVTTGGLVLAAAVVASHRARLASDLSALAGAASLRSGASTAGACDRARTVASHNGARLSACTVSGMDIDVTVTVRAPPWGQSAVARARAGPAR